MSSLSHQARLAALLLLAGCGRVGFEVREDGWSAMGSDSRDSQIDDSGSVPLTIMHVGGFAATSRASGATDSFGVQAAQAGDVIAMQITCRSTTAPTSVTVTATGWQFNILAGPAGAPPLHTRQVLAIAPDANAASVVVTWSGTTCESGGATLADEFRGVDISAGLTGVGVVGAEQSGVGSPSFNVVTQAPAATLWAACFTGGTCTGAPAGWTPGAASGAFVSAFRITTDPAGTQEQVFFANAGVYVVDVIELKSP
ncbi:MAG TPA: hypothetical protein VLB44_14685 [Kofleriaceae bacterium]|nr:hypothetical protein [Kofleriaceae bacterium]